MNLKPEQMRKFTHNNPNKDYVDEFTELRLKINSDIADRMERFVQLSISKPSPEDLIQLVRNLT